MLNWLRSNPALSAYRLMPLAVGAGFATAAAIGGVVVASGNLMMIGLAVGAIFGVLLLTAVQQTIWLVLVGTLALCGPLVMHVPALSRLPWLFSILGFLLLVASVLYEGTRRDAPGQSSPGFVAVAVVFMIYATGMSLLSDAPGDQIIAAFKRYFQYWGLMFALATVPFAAKQIRLWLLFMLGLAAIQLPFAIYQRIVLMPLRLNMPNQVVPVDIVTGTFEGSIFGGANNNVMVFLLIAAIAGLLAVRRESIIPARIFWPLLAVIAAPLALGETKMVAVFLPLALAVVYSDLARRRPFAFACGAVAASVLIAGLMAFYVQYQATEGRTEMSFDQRVRENLDYNIGNRGYFGGASLNRSNVVPFWWSRHGLDDPIGTVFGHGLGASHGSRGAEQLGHVDRKYPGYSIGLTAFAGLLWDVGLFGIVLYLLVLGGAFRAAGRLVTQAAPGLDRAMCRTLRAVVVMIVPALLALDVMLIAPSMQVLAAFSLGLIAWRWRAGAGVSWGRP